MGIIFGLIISLIILRTLNIIKLITQNPLTNHILKLIYIILIANLITWFFIGRNSSVEVASDDFIIQTQSFADTIHIYLKPSEWQVENIPWFYTYYSDYNNNYILKLKNKLLKAHCNEVYIYKRKFDDKEINYLLGYENCILNNSFIRNFPFLLYIESDVIAGSESNGYGSLNIWFFGWHRFAYGMRWIS